MHFTVFLVKNDLITEFTSRGNQTQEKKFLNSFKIRQQIYHIEKSLSHFPLLKRSKISN